jgi:hypothetical protein
MKIAFLVFLMALCLTEELIEGHPIASPLPEPQRLPNRFVDRNPESNSKQRADKYKDYDQFLK